jgi:2-amino-4-hydroxy-6-hydroxymethyldihydropteridine diphosphokinase
MIVIALGANLSSPVGAPCETLRAALEKLAQSGVEIVATSPFYQSEAWPDPTDPPFVNAVAIVRTELSPAGLMATLHEMETSFGRKRSTPNAPRSLDLDLIDYDGRVETGPPVLPHPRMERRAFVLVPLADVAPRWRHPVSKDMIETLITSLPDRGNSVTRLG